MTELSSALVDVRRAYRLVWAYQRRTMDVAQFIASSFTTHEFYAWTPLKFAGSPQLTTNLLRRWAWDGMTLYNASIFFCPIGANSDRLEKDQWYLEIHVDSDTAAFPDGKAEPDASTFPDPATTASKLVLVAWQNTQDAKGNWYRQMWNQADWPPKDGEVLAQTHMPVRCLQLSFDLAEFENKLAVEAAVSKFKQAILTSLDIVS